MDLILMYSILLYLATSVGSYPPVAAKEAVQSIMQGPAARH